MDENEREHFLNFEEGLRVSLVEGEERWVRSGVDVAIVNGSTFHTCLALGLIETFRL